MIKFKKITYLLGSNLQNKQMCLKACLCFHAYFFHNEAVLKETKKCPMGDSLRLTPSLPFSVTYNFNGPKKTKLGYLKSDSSRLNQSLKQKY